MSRYQFETPLTFNPHSDGVGLAAKTVNSLMAQARAKLRSHKNRWIDEMINELERGLQLKQSL